MTDEFKLRSDISMAKKADALLKNEMLIDTFKTLTDAYLNAWRNTHIEDVQAREKLFLAVNVVAKVQAHLAAIVTNGTLARRELDDLARADARKKRYGII